MSYKSPGNRPPAVLALQNLKRARSAYAYGRGNTLQWYAWLREHSTHSIPNGSAVWICGVLDEGMQFPRAPALRSARSCLKRGKSDALCLFELKEAVPAAAPRLLPSGMRRPTMRSVAWPEPCSSRPILASG
jgi:uncharacterized protein (DUF2252 family)